MKTLLPQIIILILVGFVVAASPEKPAPTAKDVDRLIRQLGDDDFAQREAATVALEQLGAVAFAKIRKVAGDPKEDAEVRRRAQDLLEKITVKFKFAEHEVMRYGHEADVHDLAVSPDGLWLLTGSGGAIRKGVWLSDLDCTVRLWALQTGQEIRCFGEHKNFIAGVAFSPDGKHVAAGGWDQRAYVWETHGGKQVCTCAVNQEVRRVVFSPDGKQVLTGGERGGLKLWDAESGKAIRGFSGHQYHVYGAVFSPDGKRILSSSRDRTVRLWDVESGKEINRWQRDTDWDTPVAFAPDGKTALANHYGSKLRLWEPASGKELAVWQAHSGFIGTIAFAPAKGCVLSATSNGEIRYWDLEGQKVLREFQGHEGGVSRIAITPDGLFALSGGRDGTVRRWELSK